jgi:hypothetical protein
MQVTLALNVATGTAGSIDLQFTDEPMVSIRVVDSEGRPLARWLVTVMDGGDFLPKIEQATDMFGRVQFARFPESGATVVVSDADVPGPLAPLVIHSFRPASGENVLVVENAHAEPSAILGLVSTPGWTAAESIGIEIRQPGVRGIGTLRLGVVDEPFALEPISAGTADLSLRMGPTLLHHLGVWELPAGGFCDLGHIEVPAPGRVRFAREAESSNEGEAAEYWILLPVSTPVDSVKQPVARLPGLPEDHVDLLPGSYMLFYVDRQGVEHSISFDVRSRESGVVTVPSSP